MAALDLMHRPVSCVGKHCGTGGGERLSAVLGAAPPSYRQNVYMPQYAGQVCGEMQHCSHTAAPCVLTSKHMRGRFQQATPTAANCSGRCSCRRICRGAQLPEKGRAVGGEPFKGGMSLAIAGASLRDGTAQSASVATQPAPRALPASSPGSLGQ